MAKTGWIDEHVDIAARAIRVELAEPSGDQLAIPGLELVLMQLAEKIAIGVVAGLISRAIFERWFSTKQRVEMEKLKTEIEALKRPFQPAEVVAIQSAVEHELITEGVPCKLASRITIHIITDIRSSMPH